MMMTISRKALVGFSIGIAQITWQLICPAIAYSQSELAAHAAGTLSARCETCHKPGGMAGDVFGPISDVKGLIAQGIVKPGDPEGSPMIQKIESGEMPLGGPKMSGPELDGLKAWITSLAADQATPCVSESQLENEAAADLESLPAADRKNTRYFSLGSIYESGGADAVKSAILAISKALNSVSWGDKIVTPKIVGSSGLLMSFSLKDVGMTADQWESVQNADPFKATHQTKEARQKLLSLSGSSFPVVRGDFFADNALQSPLYKRLVLGTNTVEEDVEKSLGINRQSDIDAGKVIRSGFLHSGVSVNNRVIERHKTKFGAFWISYDFSDSTGDHNIFSHPTSFDRSGGEAIFNLPNGMQAYMLVNHDGKLLDEAPLAIVSDPARPDRAVQNAISCFRCHSNGLNEGQDQIRDHVTANPSLFTASQKTEVARLYPEHAAFTAQLNEDSARYQAALNQIDPSLATATAANDPLVSLNKTFEGPLSLNQAACEAELTPQQLVQTIKAGGGKLNDISGLATTCDIARDTFENSFPELRSEVVSAVQAAVEQSPDAVSSRAAAAVIAAKNGGASSLTAVTAAMESAAKKVNNPSDFLKIVDPIVAHPSAEAQAATDQFIANHLDELAKLGGTASDYEKIKGDCRKLSTCSGIIKQEAALATTKYQLLQAFNPGVDKPGPEYLAQIDPVIRQNIAKLSSFGGAASDYESVLKEAVTPDTKTAVLQAAIGGLKNHDEMTHLLEQVGTTPDGVKLVETFKSENSSYFK
jgi:hypothetical protein